MEGCFIMWRTLFTDLSQIQFTFSLDKPMEGCFIIFVTYSSQKKKIYNRMGIL
jgi:hypothetical protein